MERNSLRPERTAPRGALARLGSAAEKAHELMSRESQGTKPSDRERIQQLEEQLRNKDDEIQDLLEENEDLKKDEVTGLLLRKSFKMELNERLERPIKNAIVAIIDLKSMKWINDNFSHATGDVFLKGVADRLSDIFLHRDEEPSFARWGVMSLWYLFLILQRKKLMS